MTKFLVNLVRKEHEDEDEVRVVVHSEHLSYSFPYRLIEDVWIVSDELDFANWKPLAIPKLAIIFACYRWDYHNFLVLDITKDIHHMVRTVQNGTICKSYGFTVGGMITEEAYERRLMIARCYWRHSTKSHAAHEL